MGISDSGLQGRMVFLVGARRSGTNWLQRTVCAHPDAVAIPSETHLFSHGLAPLADRFHQGAVSSPKTAKVWLPRSELLDVLRDVADRVLAGIAAQLDPTARLIVERTPWHAHHLDLIGAVYPDAAVVHIVRDGRDVARSLLSQPWGPTTMEEAAREWQASVRDAQASGRTLPRYREVRYEALLADPRSGLAELYGWLGLETSPAVVDQALVEASVRFNIDARNPVIGEGKWRTDLSAFDQRTFDRVAGATLAELGYEPTEAASPLRDPVGSARALLAVAKRRMPRPIGPIGPTPDGRPSLERPAEPRQRSVARLEQVQELLDSLLGAFVHGDRAALDAQLTPSALVRVIGPGGEVGGRDASARAALLDAVEARAAAGGGSHGEIHPGEPQAVIVLRGDGGDSVETLVVGLAGDLVDRFIWHRSGGGRPGAGS